MKIIFSILAVFTLLGSFLVAAPPVSAAGPVTPPVSGRDYVPGEVIVRFKPGLQSASAQTIVRSSGGNITRSDSRGRYNVVKAPAGKTVPDMLAFYAAQPGVQYAEPNYIAHATWSPNDPLYTAQWNFTQINLEPAWGLDLTAPNYGGDPGIVVAVIDSGVAYENYTDTNTHVVYAQAPDLAQTHFWTNSGEIPGDGIDNDGNGYVDDVHGWDFINQDAHPNDDFSHGTHITGTIAQSTNNTIGAAGIAFNTTIMPLKVLDQTGSGDYAGIIDAIYYAADKGVKVINFSLGGDAASSAMLDALKYAYEAGVTIVAAAGNGGAGAAPSYPAAYDDYVIAVGATRFDQARAWYSTTGAYVDIAAPGGEVTSDNQTGGIVQQTFTTGNFANFTNQFIMGTSSATPHVSGVAALILARHPSWNPPQVRQAILRTTTDLGAAGKDNNFGWGLLNAAAAVNATMPAFISYIDPGYLTASDNFSDSPTGRTVYMKAAGLLPGMTYRAAYYDGAGTLRATVDNVTSASGAFTTHHLFAAGETSGTWRAVLTEPALTPPPAFSSSWKGQLASDTFLVGVAIPEWPTVFAAGFSILACAAFYLWMRKRQGIATV